MAWGQPLGLDELMIVNPSPPNPKAYFLGEDGTLYQVQGLGQTEELQGPGQYFLGEDGTLYQVQGIGFGEAPQVPVRQHTCHCMRR
jgi:hypothetical protein